MQAKGKGMNKYNRMIALEDNGALDCEAAHYNETAEPIDYNAEYDAYAEYNDCRMAGYYQRQHALAVRGNAENGIIYYQTDDVRVLALGYVEE
jgi:hypothetical protein